MHARDLTFSAMSATLAGEAITSADMLDYSDDYNDWFDPDDFPEDDDDDDIL